MMKIFIFFCENHQTFSLEHHYSIKMIQILDHIEEHDQIMYDS